MSEMTRSERKKIIDTYIKLHKGKIFMHWMWAAIIRVAAGQDEDDVMDDFGYYRQKPISNEPITK